MSDVVKHDLAKYGDSAKGMRLYTPARVALALAGATIATTEQLKFQLDADSVGVYLTWQPRIGRTDAERDCISNRRLEGLSYVEAAFRIVRLMQDAKQLGATGVALRSSAHLPAKTPRPDASRLGGMLSACLNCLTSRRTWALLKAASSVGDS